MPLVLSQNTQGKGGRCKGITLLSTICSWLPCSTTAVKKCRKLGPFFSRPHSSSTNTSFVRFRLVLIVIHQLSLFVWIAHCTHKTCFTNTIRPLSLEILYAHTTSRDHERTETADDDVLKQSRYHSLTRLSLSAENSIAQSAQKNQLRSKSCAHSDERKERTSGKRGNWRLAYCRPFSFGLPPPLKVGKSSLIATARLPFISSFYSFTAHERQTSNVRSNWCVPKHQAHENVQTNCAANCVCFLRFTHLCLFLYFSFIHLKEASFGSNIQWSLGDSHAVRVVKHVSN